MASRAKAPEFGGQVKVSIEGTNRTNLNRENFDEANRTSARRKGHNCPMAYGQGE
jgi:hypothetical protein